MGVKETVEINKSKASGSELEMDVAVTSTFTRPAYHEIPETQAEQLDVLAQMKANLNQLEDLQGRLRFVMGEVRSAIRKY